MRVCAAKCSQLGYSVLCISIVLAFAILATVIGGLLQRIVSKKGIGWQFIRFNVIAISLPLAAILALNDSLGGEVAAIIASVTGYAFGKSGSPNDE